MNNKFNGLKKQKHKFSCMDKIKNSLRDVKGLNFLTFLCEEQKNFIRIFEETNNKGVLEALKREYVVLLSHDSSFRYPAEEIVIRTDGEVIFPPVPFPEIKAKNVVSSSPSRMVHNGLLAQLNLSLNPEEATLIIGFDKLYV